MNKIEDRLVNICDNEHFSCSESCPVYRKNNGVPLSVSGDNCVCFKNGKLMLEFLQGRLKIKREVKKLKDHEILDMMVESLKYRVKYYNNYIEQDNVSYHLISPDELFNIISDFIYFEVYPMSERIEKLSTIKINCPKCKGLQVIINPQYFQSKDPKYMTECTNCVKGKLEVVDIRHLKEWLK
jgi:hypothetical protein